ncbi:ML domain-containing protein [Streptomyces sp. NPDC048357]|uniref:ML domain-containing protein n=1 Tax=Streptomyces sp. NPDC048357 TaxID=3154719 RepID=UPI003439E69E
MDSWTWEDAGLSTDVLEIRSIEVTPDPPVRGKNLKMTIKGTAKQEITDGAYMRATVKLGLIKLLTKEFDLLQLLKGDASNGWTLTRASGASAEPIKPGEVELIWAFEPLSKEIPPGRFAVEVAAYTADDEDLFSVKIKLDWNLAN